MSKKLTNKFLLLTVVLVILASMLFIGVLANNSFAHADEVDEYQEVYVTYNNQFNVWGKTVLVDISEISRPYPTLEVIILNTVENIIFTDGGQNIKLYDTKITINQRSSDLNVYIDGFDFEAKDNSTAIINKSTNGTVNFINNGTSPVVITGGTRTNSGSFEDGLGISGILYTKGNISFAGEAGFEIKGSGLLTSTTYLGNLHYGNTGLQVNGNKKVYVNTTLDITGGKGLDGAYIPGLIGFDGGHGGYAFDGSNAQIIIGDAGYLTLKGGNGGNGASQFGNSGTVGGAGKGCAAYKNSIHVNDTSKFEYEAGEDGQPGFRR
ncbi:MAG: hypothetical protein E7338_01915 [Clostridiales bacterium]|nr:hypothetical protein [Clostridiales bacterium]